MASNPYAPQAAVVVPYPLAAGSLLLPVKRTASEAFFPAVALGGAAGGGAPARSGVPPLAPTPLVYAGLSAYAGLPAPHIAAVPPPQPLRPPEVKTEVQQHLTPVGGAHVCARRVDARTAQAPAAAVRPPRPAPPLGAEPETMAQLLCDVANLHASAGAASTTKSDASAWSRWERFCVVAGVDPERPDVRWAGPVELAREITLFCRFLVWT
jgi:hypothetical protein